jgi:16S rRNA G527 N7-methylase RsmG
MSDAAFHALGAQLDIALARAAALQQELDRRNAAERAVRDGTDCNYYADALHDANRGAVVEDMLDALKQAQRELDALRWQVAQADAYGSYMRHAVHPIPFAEWLARQRVQQQEVQP